ncbi:Porin domain-containing protein [Desulfonema limicola]|uniref:Porin domain-containing protein n=1 Tax=Desulfonema limicola TaxID=45656 RepID=A0A975BE80_9BACT|nr:porin [Desulfonema limicola]QTA83544.1 Porin domain-containing protein [Desulfonema limicola]
MKKIAICIFALCFAGNVYAYDLNKIQIHGFISQGYLQTDNNDFYYAKTEDGTFQFNEMGINFTTELTEQLRVGVQFLSRDLGELGNNDVDIDWAFADYRYQNWLGLRAGRIKRPFGFYNRSRDIDAARTFVMLPPMVYDDVERDSVSATIGIGIYGYLPYGFSYELQYGTMKMDEDGGEASNAAWLLNTLINNVIVGNCFSAALEWVTPLEGLTLSGTAYDLTDNVTFETSMGKLDVDATHYVASAEYTYDRLTLAAEYRYYPMEFTLNDNVKIADQTIEAWYISASYELTDWFTLGSYYGEIYSDKDDRDGDKYKARGLPGALAWRKDLALTTRFDINDYWVFKLEGHMMNGLAQVTTPPNEADEDWFLFAAKMTFSF